MVSDTVRLRRARTPNNTDSTVGRDRELEYKGHMNLPDLLPSTFRLAEQSTLFSKMSESSKDATENLSNGKYYSVSTPQISEITLEKVQFFEPEHAETVHIVDLSEDNASDTSDGSKENIQIAKKLKPTLLQTSGAEITKRDRLVIDRINSFYESDKEGHDEPLIFSDDEDGSLDNQIGANLVHNNHDCAHPKSLNKIFHSFRAGSRVQRRTRHIIPKSSSLLAATLE